MRRKLRGWLVLALRGLVGFFLIRPEELWPPKLTLGGNEGISIRRTFPFYEGTVGVWLSSNPQAAGENPVVTLRLCGNGVLTDQKAVFFGDLERITRSDGPVLTKYLKEFDLLAVVLPQRADRFVFADTFLGRVRQLLEMYDLQGRYELS